MPIVLKMIVHHQSYQHQLPPVFRPFPTGQESFAAPVALPSLLASRLPVAVLNIPNPALVYRTEIDALQSFVAIMQPLSEISLGRGESAADLAMLVLS